MDQEIRKYIEQEHNVYISENGEYYTRGDREDTYGWVPIPEEWIEEAKEDQ